MNSNAGFTLNVTPAPFKSDTENLRADATTSAQEPLQPYSHILYLYSYTNSIDK
ncbi:hypothetical protein [Arcticibacter sp. MXS-1]|uniref:hypothetical protein n=1 Tax=Arcticibacter sp. MXS-1 TaxID=3341726 RepID=UPI0035A82872